MKAMIVSQDREINPKIKGTTNKLYEYLKKIGYETLFFIQGEKNKTLFFINLFSFYWKYLKFKPDVIISFHQIAFIPAFLKKIGLIRKAKIIHAWWDAYTECAGTKRSPSLLAFFEYFNIKNSDIVFTNSKLQSEICRNLNIKCEWFQLGVEDYFLDKNIKKIKLPGKNQIKVLYIGEVSKYKRVDQLIHSVIGLECDLIIIGNCPAEFKKNCPPNVYFLEAKPHRDMPSYIKSADIVTIPADQDGSLKMYEYLALGKCIIAFKGRIGYVLTHDENVYLTIDFKKGLEELIKNKKLREKIERGAGRFPTLTLNQAFEKWIEKINLIRRKNGNH